MTALGVRLATVPRIEPVGAVMTKLPDEPARSMPVRRLRHGRSVTRALRTGWHARGRLLTVHLREHDSPRAAGEPGEAGAERHEASRLAVVASKKVGAAVVRNRAKRLLREGARRTTWPPGHDIVLVARPKCGKASLSAVVQELDALTARYRRDR